MPFSWTVPFCIEQWFTGHSLGCALASLTYARMINEPHECGQSAIVRDAYLFAAPVVCDAESSNCECLALQN